MTGDSALALEITRIEAAHLVALTGQFLELLDAGDAAGSPADPAVARLVPDAYADPEAAREFREFTQRALLERRAADARAVIATLGDADSGVSVTGDDATLDEGRAREVVAIVLDADEATAWMRTLAALRLVLASRLGITDVDEADPRFGIYEWLGYRLDGLIQALDGD